ncbi:peptide chain release factor H [Phaeospirillum tilakii]|uniref:Peptide chain release factor H n=1 Tax=Phaeospirillum tilakii TaxID=741673 RepID=A0ABW5CD38_9PROT
MIWVLLSAGRGPGECQLAVRGLTTALCAEAAQAGIDAELLETEDGPHGPVSALLALKGGEAEALARDWEGTVRWTCPSPLRPGWKRKNWFVGVSLLAPPPAGPAWDERDLRFDTCRASGPGGQHVNKTNSAVRVTHLKTGLTAFAQEERSQHRNKALAVARLAAQLAERDEKVKASANQDRRNRHDQLERGGERRVYAGPDFRRIG